VPELPEVETVVREVRPYLVGRHFTAVQTSRKKLRRRWSKDWAGMLLGSEITGVSRRGKWILLAFASGRHLVIHLGMSGQLTVVPTGESLQPHTHLIFALNQGDRQLRFRDIRRFGSATLFADRRSVERFFDQAGLGPEPFDLEAKYWRTCLAGTGRCLKAVLLDQRAVAGVGNIYADESLFTAGLHPGRLGRDLTAAEANRLRRAIARVLHRAIDRRGSSIRNYVGGSGLRGGYQEEFVVYGRTGEPCRRCGEAIARLRLAGRSTHFCPRCQPEGRAGGVSPPVSSGSPGGLRPPLANHQAGG
jgi:formamidopyrimidine-DNA glycosylase